jgi:hypothetical protein
MYAVHIYCKRLLCGLYVDFAKYQEIEGILEEKGRKSHVTVGKVLERHNSMQLARPGGESLLKLTRIH